jgi:hypothetical protein
MSKGFGGGPSKVLTERLLYSNFEAAVGRKKSQRILDVRGS